LAWWEGVWCWLLAAGSPPLCGQCLEAYCPLLVGGALLPVPSLDEGS
jgi:hypothetical protein